MDEKLINDLKSKVYDDQDLILFEEAISCLKNDLFRASYIMTWLSIAESIKHKLYKMSERDSAIKKCISKIERFEEEHKSIDKLIIDRAYEFGIINKIEKTKLEFIYTQRCIYSHPYEMAPKPQEVEAALVIAVDCVLSKPPFLRYGYVCDFVKRLLTKHYFIDNLPRKIWKLSNEIVPRISPELHPFMFKKLCEGLEKIIYDPDNAPFCDRGILFAQGYLSHIKSECKLAELNFEELLDNFPNATTRIFIIKTVWPDLPSRVQDMLLLKAIQPIDGNDIPSIILDQVSQLYKEDLLNKRGKELFKKSIEKCSLKNLALGNVPFSLYIDRVIFELQSHNWYAQNPAAELLLDVDYTTMCFASGESLENLGRNILQAAQGDSKGAISLLNRILDCNRNWPLDFIRGIMYECFFNEKNEIRFKCEFMTEALKIHKNICPDEFKKSIDVTIQKLENSSLKDNEVFKEDFDKAITKVRDFVQHENVQNDVELFEKCRHLIKVIESRKNEVPDSYSKFNTDVDFFVNNGSDSIFEDL